MSYDKKESNIRAPVLLNLLYSLRKSDKMLSKPRILLLFHNLFNKCTLFQNQTKKRKADQSFHGKENETSQNKIPKTDTLSLPREETLSSSQKK